MTHILTVDIGGTNVKMALSDEEGKLDLFQEEALPESLDRLYEAVLKYKRACETVHQKKVGGLAISAPGYAGPNGKIAGPSAVAYLHEQDPATALCDMTNLPVTLENDANCAAFSEYWLGGAKGRQSCALIIIGTGIGGALIEEGALKRNRAGESGEWGKLLVPSPSGPAGTLTVFSRTGSTGALVRDYASQMGLTHLLSGEQIFNLADEGQEAAVLAVASMIRQLSIGILNIHSLYMPEVILIGGGISNRHDLLDKLQAQIRTIIGEVEEVTQVPNLAYCHFKSKANLVGAVYHHLSHRKKVKGCLTSSELISAEQKRR